LGPWELRSVVDRLERVTDILNCIGKFRSNEIWFAIAQTHVPSFRLSSTDAMGKLYPNQTLLGSSWRRTVYHIIVTHPGIPLVSSRCRRQRNTKVWKLLEVDRLPFYLQVNSRLRLSAFQSLIYQ